MSYTRQKEGMEDKWDDKDTQRENYRSLTPHKTQYIIEKCLHREISWKANLMF